MTEKLTPVYNRNSIEFIKNQISKKNGSNPYIATGNMITSVITDMDCHPYQRFWRGVYYYPEPIAMERETGYRKIEENCYDVIQQRPSEIDRPHLVWEVPCTTTVPTYPSKVLENSSNDMVTNNICLVQYR
jgi:hypothetical protein